MKRALPFHILALLLLASTAHARFVLLDVIFDDKQLSAQMGRLGARYEEPIPDPDDSITETVVVDSGTDYSVRIRDQKLTGPDRLTWDFKNGLEVVDGRLNISLEIRPNSLNNYEFSVEGPNGVGHAFFKLVLNSSGEVSWADGDDPALTLISLYSPSDLLLISLAFDMQTGRYDFTLNGVAILLGEAHGVTGRGIALVRVGHRADNNTTGTLDLDNLFVDYAPGSNTSDAALFLQADFDDEPVASAIGTGGAAAGQPVSYRFCVPTVASGIFATPSLAIPDQSSSTAGSASFEFLNSAEAIGGDLSISFTLLMDQLNGYRVYLREQGTSSASFLNMKFLWGGELYLTDHAGSNYYQGTYQPLLPIKVQIGFDMERRRYSVWVDGVRIAHRREHGITDHGVGQIQFGSEFDTDTAGTLYVDNIKVYGLGPYVTAVAESVPPRPGPLVLHAIPNPFSPSADMQVTLAEPGRVTLEILDTAGRLVALPASREMSAGDHAIRWNGLGVAGQALASGVYFSRVTLAGVSGLATAHRKFILVR